MRDRAYAQRLAQRLCELCSGLEIEICGKGEFCEWNDTADGYRLYGGCDIVSSVTENCPAGLLRRDITFLKLQRKECFLPVPADSGDAGDRLRAKNRKKFFAETGVC